LIIIIVLLKVNAIAIYIDSKKLNPKNTASLSVAQISEFSLIIIFLGAKMGHVSNEVVSIITLVAVATISVSTYFIIHNGKIYDKISAFLPFLRSKRFFEDSLHQVKSKEYSVICLGFSDAGKKIFIEKLNKKEMLVVDFDPKALKEAKKHNFDTLYGDVSDLEIMEFIINTKPKIVISTIMQVNPNKILAKKLITNNHDIKLIVLAEDIDAAKRLHKVGIEFVLVPPLITADKVKIILEDIKKGKEFELNWLKKTEFNYTDLD